MVASSNPSIFTVSRDHLDGGKDAPQKKPLTSKASLKKLFSDSRSPEGAPQMAAGPNHSIFSGFRATSRIAAYLQCKTHRGLIIPCKNEGILFRESTAEGRREDGAFSPFVGVSWGLQSPPKEVLKIRGGPRSSRQLESLYFYNVL